MEAYINFENQIVLMDSIIQSVTEMINAFKGKDNDNGQVRTSIKQIFHFLDKIIEVFPRIILADDHNTIIKDKLLRSIVRSKREWETAMSINDNFETNWNDLSFWWNEYRKQLKKIQETKHALYLSTN